MRLDWPSSSTRPRLLAKLALRLAFCLPVIGGAALADATSSGSYCTAIYGVGGNAITFFNTTNSTFSTLTTNPSASDMNATGVDRSNGRIYYVDRGVSAVWYYDPISQQHVKVGNFSPPPGVSPTNLIAGGFDENGNYYIYYGEGSYTTLNKSTGQAAPYKKLSYNGNPALSSTTNGDIAFNGTQGYLIYETGSSRRSNVFDFNSSTGALSNPKPMTLNGSPVTSDSNGGINGLAYEPASGTFYISTSGGTITGGLYQLDVSSGAITLKNKISGINDLSSCSRPRPFPPSVTKVFNPPAANAPAANKERVSTLSLTINNPNAAPLYLNSSFDDVFPTSPAQMSIASTPNLTITPANCVASSKVVATAGATRLTVVDGAGFASGSCTISVNVTVPKAGSYLNTVAAGELDTTTGKNPQPTSATLTVTPVDIKVVKTGPATANVGEVFSFTVTSSNVSQGTALNVVTTDTLPAGLNFVSADNGGTYNAPSRTVTWPTVASLAPNAKQVYSVSVSADVVSAGQSLTNVAKVATPTPETDLTNNTDQATVKITNPTVPVPNSGTCTTAAPYLQTFNSGGPLAEVRNHRYLTDANTVTNTDGSYTVWNQIDHTGNGGSALYYNIANFENKNGGNLTTPGLLYESQITVPAGSTISYENYVRSHSNTATQLQYRFYDGVSGSLLQSYNGALATTDYTKQSVPSFVSPSNKVIVRLYTLKDGTTADLNVLKLDDIKLTCPLPAAALSITKTHTPATFQVLQAGLYTINVSNAVSSAATSGVITVKDQLPVGIGAALPSGFSPAAGWTCTYSGEAEQGVGYAPNPNEAQLLTCTTTTVLASGSSVNLSIPVNVTPKAGSNVVNKASVGGGGDTDPLPDPATCTVGAQCAQDTAPVTPLPVPPATCSTGTPTNLLASPITGYQDNDSATLQSDGKLITDAAAYSTGTGPSGSFVIDGTYFFNNGYGPISKASTLQLVVNGTVYASFLTEDAYSGRASVVPANGASLEGGAASLTLNRYTSSKIWVTLPSSVKSISSVQVKFISNASGGGVSDDYGFTVANALACTQPAPPKALLDKTVQNITANGPVTRDSLGKPGDVLEYCLTASNIGNTSVTKLGLGDNIPASTTAQVGGYGPGKDVKYTLPDGTTKFLTFAADGDAAQLGKDTNGITPRLFVNDTTLTLAPSKSFIVCFRATIN
ncbi:DUF11 domain-containing protein [Deinococcus psychrotolerans]|uniref:DUF11 domain-containing protein n=1 Tax=Deinococcus psychrotolerans TaxID=2489213 RepID=A0A3G8YKF5_9DEIO|nr:DUF11 domain-containing protein [Deinococcus psychrotolerans]AZI41546.1 DUF11 domain-containing protein [Deinococcus psychrotolerans]